MRLLVQPDPSELKALQELRYNPDVVKYLKRALETSKDMLLSADDGNIKRVQGVGLAHEHLLKLITEDR